MAVKSYNPTTPTRRFQTVVSREDITKQSRRRAWSRASRKTGGRSQHRPRLVALHRRRTQADLPRSSISSAISAGFRPRSPPSNTIRTAARASLCCITSMARSATSSRRWAWKSDAR